MWWLLANGAFFVFLVVLYFINRPTYQAIDRFVEAHGLSFSFFYFLSWIAAWQWERICNWFDDLRHYFRTTGELQMSTWSRADDPNGETSWEAPGGGQNVATQRERQLTNQLSALLSAYPDLPAIPRTPIEYESWFGEALSRIRLRSKQRSLEEWSRLLATVKNLHKEYHEIFEIRFSIDRMSGEETARRLQKAKEIIELQAQIEKAQQELNAVRNPPRPSPAQAVAEQAEEVKAKVQLLQQQLEYEKLQKEIQSVKNAANIRTETARGPSDGDPVKKILMEFLRRQSVAHKERNDRAEIERELLSFARDIGGKFGDAERVERDAKKLMEEWYQKQR